MRPRSRDRWDSDLWQNRWLGRYDRRWDRHAKCGWSLIPLCIDGREYTRRQRSRRGRRS